MKDSSLKLWNPLSQIQNPTKGIESLISLRKAFLILRLNPTKGIERFKQIIEASENNENVFQFPLLGSGWKMLVCEHFLSIPFVGFGVAMCFSETKTVQAFNSLCWVHNHLLCKRLVSRIPFNSLCWVPQYPTTSLGCHIWSFNSLCWVPILLFLFLV